MPIHHKIARSRGGSDDDWNLTEWDEYTHAYEHALDFVLFPQAPSFDFRMPGWPLLPEELRLACRKERARRMSERVVSEETRRKVGVSSRVRMLAGLASYVASHNKGKPKTEAHRKKIGDAQRGVPHEIVTCPHCGASGGISAMKRWHFNNCKHVHSSTSS